jgi:hypothetical protein
MAPSLLVVGQDYLKQKWHRGGSDRSNYGESAEVPPLAAFGPSMR